MYSLCAFFQVGVLDVRTVLDISYLFVCENGYRCLCAHFYGNLAFKNATFLENDISFLFVCENSYRCLCAHFYGNLAFKNAKFLGNILESCVSQSQTQTVTADTSSVVADMVCAGGPSVVKK